MSGKIFLCYFEQQANGILPETQNSFPESIRLPSWQPNIGCTYSMKITERNPKNSNENEKRRQKVKSAKSAQMGKGNIF